MLVRCLLIVNINNQTSILCIKFGRVYALQQNASDDLEEKQFENGLDIITWLIFDGFSHGMEFYLCIEA